ncbi:MAG TPA: 3-mercaptopyruvate sulfurtransferase [Alphaproteobacteria bacterium]|nr:3-mercaptopyruvate sulfurtransferase [Alphaproteobacteria bacterium]
MIANRRGYAHPEALAATEWLAQHLDAPDLRIVDATWYMPSQGRDARAEYQARHIPGAVFFDIDEIADRNSPLPHMLPKAEHFSASVRKLGLGDGNRIVVYDGHGMMSAARVWWTFRVMGHRDIAVLDGGLPKWLAEGRPVEDTPPPPRERHFSARLNHTLVKDKAAILRNLRNSRFQLLDARSAGRFEGSEAEPWPARRSGHIPGSRNLPYTELLDPKDKTFLPADALAAKFAAAGIDPKKPVVTSCGSGITAAILALGLHLIGHEDVALYDGSWAEWGLPGDTPVETGAA